MLNIFKRLFNFKKRKQQKKDLIFLSETCQKCNPRNIDDCKTCEMLRKIIELQIKLGIGK